MTLKPHTVVISVGDIAAADRWYTDMLGFVRSNALSYPENGLQLVFLSQGAFRIQLVQKKDSRPGPERPDPPQNAAVQGIMQVAYEVDDLDALHADMVRKGVKIVWALQSRPEIGVRFFFVRDPEGNLVQLVQPI